MTHTSVIQSRPPIAGYGTLVNFQGPRKTDTRGSVLNLRGTGGDTATSELSLNAHRHRRQLQTPVAQRLKMTTTIFISTKTHEGIQTHTRTHAHACTHIHTYTHIHTCGHLYQLFGTCLQPKLVPCGDVSPFCASRAIAALNKSPETPRTTPALTLGP